MPQRAITFGPSIYDEVEEMSTNDIYNVWGRETYANDVTVCCVEETDDGVRVVFDTGAKWPFFVLETISDSRQVKVWIPVDDDDGNFDGWEDKGGVDELQKEGYNHDDVTDSRAVESYEQWDPKPPV